jgi:cysteine-rich repeat protein
MRSQVAWLVLGVAVVARSAAATVADELCLPADDPCVVDRPVAVAPGSLLDFGARAVEVRRGGVLDAGPGGFTITAGSVRVLPGGALLGRDGQNPRTIAITTTGAISIEGTGTARGRIDVSGDRAGDIRLTAGGEFSLGGDLIARGVGANGRGGGVVADALVATIAPSARIVTAGGGGDFGGDVHLGAVGKMTVGGLVDASGGADGGGAIEIAGGRVELTARLDARSRVGGGDGGPIDIQATATNVRVRGPLVSTSDCDIDDACFSTGGDVTIGATGAVFLQAPVTLTGEGLDGTGGTLTIDAGTDVVQTAGVLVNARGAEGCGGEVTITAGRNVTLGAIDASGRDCDGGTVTVEAPGKVTAAGEIDADGKTGGGGGSIELIGEHVAIVGGVHASSGSAFGGTVEVEACGALEVTVGADVATRGDLGENSLSAARGMTIAGSLRSGTGAAGAGGTNELVFPSAGSPPMIEAGAVVVPDATLTPADLQPCPSPPPARCGNGVLDPDEECDDGNADACDGCSATCTLEGCGNHVVEADCGEECDDGNADACDGCSPTCTTETCGNGTLECAEACDAGVDNGTLASGCDATCALVPPPGCGDGTTGAGESCDDGNTAACDGCSSVCQAEACGDDIVECGEECDDGNRDPCDGCSPACTLETCGDGVAQCEEECDDGAGNGAPGGSCDLGCRLGTICGLVTNESPCIACADDTDCDPAGRCGGGACTDGVCGQVPVPSCDDQSAGTIDRCVLDETGAPTCEHACISDQACDDGNGCTIDTCAGVQGCVHAPVLGLPAISCRLSAIAGALDASAGEARAGLTRQLGKRLGKLTRQVDAAGRADAAGSVRRERKVLRNVVAGLRQLGKVVARARRKKKISAQLADTIGQAAGEASSVAAELRSSLRT